VGVTVQKDETRTSHVILICFVAAVGGFLFGYDLVIVSRAQLSVTK
jgi:preprotein translocase subunit SecE